MTLRDSKSNWTCFNCLWLRQIKISKYKIKHDYSRSRSSPVKHPLHIKAKILYFIRKRSRKQLVYSFAYFDYHLQYYIVMKFFHKEKRQSHERFMFTIWILAFSWLNIFKISNIHWKFRWITTLQSSNIAVFKHTILHDFYWFDGEFIWKL